MDRLVDDIEQIKRSQREIEETLDLVFNDEDNINSDYSNADAYADTFRNQSNRDNNNNNNNNNNIIIQNRTAPSMKHSRCSRRRPCFLCHDTNHLVRDCPEFPHDDPAEGSRIRRAAAATIPCWKCGIVGHFQRNCRAVVDVDSVVVDSDSEMSLSSIDPNNTFCTVVPSSSSSNAAAAAKTGMIRVDTRGVMQSKDPFAAYCHLLAQHGLADEWNVKRVINTGFSNHRNKAIAKKHQENWNGFRKSIYIVAY